MPIHVTKPFLPPLEEFLPYLEQMWESRILSNAGPFHSQLENELCSKLKVNQISLFGNGTLALLVAFRALGLKGAEVITTPYSFVATSSTLLWSGNTPVFVDIELDSTNIDPNKIERAITEKTKAILAVHCYGHPCKTEKIESIARKHGLKVIYDAAHAFGIETESGNILNVGDLSILSFHATKSFNTFEGGAIVSHSPEMKQMIDRLKNFGFAGESVIAEVGINAKMTEFNAAIGLLQLKHFDRAIGMRGQLDKLYRSELKKVKGIKCLENPAKIKNFGYFPVLVGKDYGLTRDELYETLKEKDFFGRRYFYPLISNFPIFSDLPSATPNSLPVANTIADQVLCLPIYPELALEAVQEICGIIRSHEKQ